MIDFIHPNGGEFKIFAAGARFARMNGPAAGNAMDHLETRREGFLISTDPERLQVGAILEYLVTESYWARNRTRLQLETVIENSLCFGVYDGARQIGFARVVTDYATFAYLGDVYILPAYQRQGLGKWLMEEIVSHPRLQGFRRWVLATRDAHALYEKYGFTDLKHPDRWMERAAPDAY